jgi:hypothetical protein
VKEQVGVLVNPFTRRMRLGSFTGVNYMLVAVKTGSSPTA